MDRSGSRRGGEQAESVEEVLNAIGDPYARDVLATIGDGSRTAGEIADDLEHSLNTVYRRLDLLVAHGLVEKSMDIAEDGNHSRRFETTFDSVVISVEDDAYDVEIYRREDVPDRFASLLDDISRA